MHWAHTSTALSFTRVRHARASTWARWGGWCFAVLVLVGTSNAVNLTDGLDGLAAGSSTFCFAVLAIMGYWIFRHYSHLPRAPGVGPRPGPVRRWPWPAPASGFLWWNAAPARIIMGDTGSLAIGSGLAALCLLLNLDLLLPIIGGCSCIETLSVIVQVVSFRVFRRRVFRMAPIHHHFELLGLARDDGDRPLLDPGRPVRCARPRASSTASSSRWPRSHERVPHLRPPRRAAAMHRMPDRWRRRRARRCRWPCGATSSAGPDRPRPRGPAPRRPGRWRGTVRSVPTATVLLVLVGCSA